MPGVAVGDGAGILCKHIMNFVEQAIRFSCEDCWLYGILSVPEQATSRGVLIVVGGPQYRAGSHRQFTLLARNFATNGVPVMRFDYRGMGDSEGDRRNFEMVGDDIHAAVDYFFSSVSAINELVILGLCDAASAALFYAHQDERISGLVLINPWIRTEEGVAKTYLKHYYLARLFEAGLWRKILRGHFKYLAAALSFSRLLDSALFPNNKNKASASSLTERMFDGFSSFKGRVLLILSENDLTAAEFSDYVTSSPSWKNLLKSSRVTRLELPGADHTFSRLEWRDQVASRTRKWLDSW